MFSKRELGVRVSSLFFYFINDIVIECYALSWVNIFIRIF